MTLRPRCFSAMSSPLTSTRKLDIWTFQCLFGTCTNITFCCRGFVTLIVNVASKWGLTEKNYKELNELHAKYAVAGLRILAFPCNQFGSQEPAEGEELMQFMRNHNVEFDVFDKINVNGDNAHPLWKFLKDRKGGGILGSFIKWNFAKFLVDKNGQPVTRYSPTTGPLDIEKDIIKLI